MSFQRMDADTTETLAGVVRLLRRAAELVWAVVDAEGVGSPRQVLGLGIDLAGDEARNLCRTGFQSTGLCRSAMNRPISFALPSSCCSVPRSRESGPRLMRCGRGWPPWCGK